jgi:hypothetical protein
MAGMGTLQAITTDIGNFPDVYLVPDFLGQVRASRLLATLWAELSWTQHEISLFGRKVCQPRLSCWYGDPGAHYTYSGLHLQPNHWHPALEDMRRVLENTLDTRFNSVLANAYRNGRDSMGWHADDEGIGCRTDHCISESRRLSPLPAARTTRQQDNLPGAPARQSGGHARGIASRLPAFLAEDVETRWTRINLTFRMVFNR